MARGPTSATHADWPPRLGLGLFAAALYAVVGVLAVRVRGGTTPLGIDREVSRLVGLGPWPKRLLRAQVARSLPPGLVRWLVVYWLPAGAVGVALVLAVVSWRRGDLRAAALCLIGPALAVVLTDDVLKPLVDRHHGTGLAYPSGHATGAAAVATLLLVLLHRWRGWRSTAWLAPVALTLPLVMGLALVRLAFHYPTDVVGGTAMGTATVLAVAVALDAQRARPSAAST